MRSYSPAFRAALGILLLGAAVYPMLYLYLAVRHLGYPFELEWMEGGMVDHVRRILLGRGLYVRPTIEFVPFVYTPLYFYISALFAKVMGLGFAPLRLVSVLASLGCLALIFEFVRRETRSAVCALLSVCFFTACYRVCGFWYDLGRIDSLFLLLLLAAVTIVRRARHPLALTGAGLLLVLAFLTKQSTLFVAGPLCLAGMGLAVRPWPRRLICPLVLGAGVALTTLVFNRVTGGWYGYYVFELPSQHPIEQKLVAAFWTRDILSQMPVAMTLLLVFLGSLAWRRRWRDLWFFSFLTVGTLGCSWASRMHSGGFVNVLIPAVAMLSLGVGLALNALCPGLHFRRPAAGAGAESDTRPARAVARAAAGWLAVLACGGQFYMLRYEAGPLLPAARDIRAGLELVSKMRHVQGDVLLMTHGYLPLLAGKEPTAHQQALSDIYRARGGRKFAEELSNAYQDALRQGRFGAVITDTAMLINYPKSYPVIFKTNFICRGNVISEPNTLRPITGMNTRPELLYEWRK